MQKEEFKATLGETRDGKIIRLPDVTTVSKPFVVNQATTLPEPELADRDSVCERWGVNNMAPTDKRKKLAKIPMAGITINRLVKFMYGDGLYYYREDDVRDGDNEVTRAYIPEVEDFLRRNRIRTHWYPQQCHDYLLHGNCFSEIIMSNDRSTVMGLYHKTAEYCRLSAQNLLGRNEYLLYSPYWQLGNATADKRVPIRLFQWDMADQFLETQRSTKYSWHTRMPDGDVSAYAVPPSDGLFRTDGWMDVSIEVPQIIRAMQKNQIVLKYEILISAEYFRLRYDDYDSKSQEERTKIFNTKVTEIANALAGSENRMQSIGILMETNAEGREEPLIKINAIDDKTKVGTWVPDAEKSDAQIVQGFGLDPSQVGLQPSGGKMGAGSGSDKRESFNTAVTLNTMDQEIILEVLHHVSQRNGWGVRFMISHTAHTTLNQSKSGLEPEPMPAPSTN